MAVFISTRLALMCAGVRPGFTGLFRHLHAPFAVALLTWVQFEHHSSRRDDMYNILWAVVFGFATLNILTLAGRRFEPNRRGMSFGEVMAVLVVFVSIFLLGWELLSVFHVFPIKIRR